MNMALAGGKAGGISAALHSGSSINKFKPISAVQKTQGSVFGALTHGASGRKQPSGTAIGSILSGNFGSLSGSMAVTASKQTSPEYNSQTALADSAEALDRKMLGMDTKNIMFAAA